MRKSDPGHSNSSSLPGRAQELMDHKNEQFETDGENEFKR